jgi:reactive intermediate/imine deaminase
MLKRSFRRFTLSAVAISVLAGCAATNHRGEVAKPEFLNTKQSLERGLPFSEAVRAGGLLFLAGQIGSDAAKSGVVPGGIVPESRQALTHIKDVLERNGLSLADVVKCTVFLADMAEWGAFNNVYKEFFSQPYPARSAFGVNGLAMGARVEVECIAGGEERK